MIAHSRRHRFARALCLAIAGLSSLLLLRALVVQRSWRSLRIFENLPARSRRNALVVASLKDDDVSWLLAILPEWEKNIYVANDADATLTVPTNKGRESMVYLSFIVDNYDHLPQVTVFMHSQRYQWHNDDPLYDGIPVLQNLQLPYVAREGYVNLRCAWILGCPAEIRPTTYGPNGPIAEKYYENGFKELFPNTTVPEVIGVGCCAQFAVSREKLLERPLEDYKRYRRWLLTTPLEDQISGRIMEYSWHMIFSKSPIHCPDAGACYCRTFGLCDLNCTQTQCDGRYTLPPYSVMPEGWPENGWP